MADPTTIHVIVVIFIAALVQSTFGFGQALVAVPLLSLRIPLAVAAPLMVLMSITASAAILSQDWRKVEVRPAAWLVVWSLAGLPLGLFLLKRANPDAMKMALGLFIAGFSIYSLTVQSKLHLRREHASWLIGSGLFAGILSGAYAMGGPPLVIYGSLRRWSPQHFRATLQGCFLPTSVAALIGYAAIGLWAPAVTRYFLLSLPGAVVAILIGRLINHRLRGDLFFRFVYIGLLAISGALIAQAIAK